MAERKPDSPDSERELRAQLDALPPNVKGELIDGELFVQPRPRFRHGRANTFLGHHLGGSFDFDEGGPGGWWIRIGVPWLWVIDPAERTLEVLKLVNGLWTVWQTFGDEAAIRAEPFDQIEIPLQTMWMPA